MHTDSVDHAPTHTPTLSRMHNYVCTYSPHMHTVNTYMCIHTNSFDHTPTHIPTHSHTPTHSRIHNYVYTCYPHVHTVYTHMCINTVSFDHASNQPSRWLPGGSVWHSADTNSQKSALQLFHMVNLVVG